MMQNRIEISSEKKLAGKRMEMSFSRNTTVDLWKSFMPRRKEIEKKVDENLYSVQLYNSSFFTDFDVNAKFEKWAAVEVTDFESIPEGMQTITIPGGLYAVFIYKGMPAEAEPFFAEIFRDWLPNSKYELDDRPHFEVLGEKYKNNDPDSEEEVWIPVRMRLYDFKILRL